MHVYAHIISYADKVALYVHDICNHIDADKDAPPRLPKDEGPTGCNFHFTPVSQTDGHNMICLLSTIY